jgi:Kunitz/Bovine pancreatic trypsin inhibitor domain
MLEPKLGSCRTQAENRWYFDKQSNECHIFPYTGCHGNKNNFETREQCQQICTRKPFHLTADVTELHNFPFLTSHTGKISKDLQSHPFAGDERKAGEKIDCEMTQWKRGICNVTCGDGYRWKSRAIIVSSTLTLTDWLCN